MEREKIEQNLSFDPQAFDKFFSKCTAKASEGGDTGKLKEIRYRKASIIIYPEMCRPDTFDNPVKISLRELSSKDELDVLKSLSGSTDEKSMAMELAKQAMCQLNGRYLTAIEKDLVWEAIGFSGRLCLGNAFMAHCTGANEAILEKSLRSVEIE